MNSKMTTNSQLSTTESKKLNKTKQTNKKLSKQPKQEQNHRYGDHMRGYQLAEGRGRIGEKVQGLRSIN